MKRLTDKRLALPPGVWQEVTREKARELKEIPVPPMRELYYRLSLYEDTGLEPEEILSAVDMAKVACSLEALNAYKELGSLDRLRELAEADREGRCVVLPITVPGWGWTCRDGFPTAISAYYPFPSSVLRSMESGYVFGKTKDEAEAVLAKLNSGT